MKPEWQIPIQMKFVRFAKEMINKYPVDYVKEYGRSDMKKRLKIDRSINEGNTYMIPNICIKGFSVKDTKQENEKGHIFYEDKGAVFFYDEIMLVLHHSWYPIRFSVPKSCIIDYQTEETEIPQNITINEYAYKHCYMDRLNRILENHGRNLFNLLQLEENDLRFRGSPYKDLIFKIQIDNIKERWKKDEEKPNMENVNNENIEVDREERVKTSIPTETRQIFYTDGSGNLYNDKKTSNKGHYSILLKNTEEKWRRDEDKLTSNQAELKGVIGAFVIATKRGYKDVEIRTDSQAIINWISGAWSAKNPNITKYVEILNNLVNKYPYIKVRKIPRDKNWAHPV